MANKIQLKRSAVAAKVPTTTDLDLGEIGVNTYDGKVYIKKDSGTPSIVEVTGPGVAPGTTGNVLTSNGTSWTSSAPSAPAPTFGLGTTMLVEQDFVGGFGISNNPSSPAGVCGNCVYRAYDGSPPVATSTTLANPGQINFPYPITVGQWNYVALANNGAGMGWVTWNQFHSMVVIVNYTHSSNNIKFGLVDATSNNPGVRYGMYFEGYAGGQATTENANTLTRTATTLSVTTWYKLEIRKNGSSVEFYKNGSLVATHTTNIPTSSPTFLIPVCMVTNDNNIGRVYVDYMGVRLSGLTAR